MKMDKYLLLNQMGIVGRTPRRGIKKSFEEREFRKGRV